MHYFTYNYFSTISSLKLYGQTFITTSHEQIKDEIN